MKFLETGATHSTAFVPGWQIDIPILLIVAIGVWLLFDGTRADKAEADPYWHEFKPDCPWGPVQQCAEWVEGDDGEEPCGLGRREHALVYGEVRDGGRQDA